MTRLILFSILALTWVSVNGAWFNMGGWFGKGTQGTPTVDVQPADAVQTGEPVAIEIITFVTRPPDAQPKFTDWDTKCRFTPTNQKPSLLKKGKAVAKGLFTKIKKPKIVDLDKKIAAQLVGIATRANKIVSTFKDHYNEDPTQNEFTGIQFEKAKLDSFSLASKLKSLEEQFITNTELENKSTIVEQFCNNIHTNLEIIASVAHKKSGWDKFAKLKTPGIYIGSYATQKKKN